MFDECSQRDGLGRPSYAQNRNERAPPARSPSEHQRQLQGTLGAGRVGTWQDEPLGVVLRLQFGAAPADAPLILHENLRVRLSGAYEATVEVPWWREGGVTHVRAQPIARTS